MSTNRRPTTGAHLIGGEWSAEVPDAFQAVDPATGETLPASFAEATEEEVARAAGAADAAHRQVRDWSGEQIARLLRACSQELMELGDALLRTAELETGLSETRLRGERARTCAQFEMFADLVSTGGHIEATIDHADPAATPPRPDLRRIKVGVGPVAVFGASNFPLAFSVPGGDTASALAANCPVVIKAHPSHPATSELCAQALQRAVDRTEAPAGTVNLVHGRGHDVGRALVLADEIRSVAFTGSTKGGRALHDLAAAREHPIPVHAEMGSVNPVIVTPRALAARGDAIATDLVASLRMGAGQFCTSPGLIFVPGGEEGDRFVDRVAGELGQVPSAPLLNRQLQQHLADQVRSTAQRPGVQTLLDGSDTGSDAAGEAVLCAPYLFTVDLDTYVSDASIREEHFGPVAIVVRSPKDDAYRQVLDHLDGQLTLTLHAEEAEAVELSALRHDFNTVAGRVIFNAFPTGVSVTAAQHHGGPYPATSDPRFTSVGTYAIQRFLRPVTYQNSPAVFLPPELRDDNPLGVPQRVDGNRA